MLGSLIGIFLTSAGIVIGADTALSDLHGPATTRVEKACKPSQRSIAAMEGWYGEDLYLHRRFHDACRELSRLRKPISIERQADRLIQKLQKAYKDHLGPLPRTITTLPSPSRQHVMYVTVAGFDGTTPVATGRALRWEKNPQGKWEVITERTSYLSFQGCGAKFVGETTIATMLLDGAEYFDRAKDRAELSAGRTVARLSRQEECAQSSFSVEEAKALYKTSVRMTIDHGEHFLVDTRNVGGRLRLFTIPLVGSIEEETVEPEQYVGDDSPVEGRFFELTVSPEREGGESS